MAKLETPAAIPPALRPPRPAVRMRAGAAAADEGEGEHAAGVELRGEGYGQPPYSSEPYSSEPYSPGAYARAAYPQGVYPGDPGPEVIEVLELDDDEVVAEPADGSELPLSDSEYGSEAVTERGFDASTFGLPRAGGTKLPMASLEMPSASRLDLTPSPVPRVALSPATGAVDISLVPGPHASRNLPTLAAHHVLGRRPVRRPASAITFPPHHPERRGSAELPRLGAGLAKDVRSSKREIVLGLAIGLGLSLVLAAAGQAYLHEEPVASSPPPEVQSLALSARPEAAATAPSAGDGSLERALPATPRGEPAVAEPIARALADRAAFAERAVVSEHLPASDRVAVADRGLSSQLAGARARRALPAGDRLEGSDSERAQAVARRSQARRDGASAAPGPGRASSSAEQAAGKPYDVNRAYEGAPPTRAPQSPASQSPASLSPAESAGLGLDLPL